MNIFLQLDDEQWQRAMEYVNGVSELNYMTQIVIMLYEDPTKASLFTNAKCIVSVFQVSTNSQLLCSFDWRMKLVFKN